MLEMHAEILKLADSIQQFPCAEVSHGAGLQLHNNALICIVTETEMYNVKQLVKSTWMITGIGRYT